MSTRRFTKAPFQGQKGRCAWCGTTNLPKGRTSWCSQACVDAYKMRAWPSAIRDKVFERDKGICAVCGIDSDAAYRAWKQHKGELKRLFYWFCNAERVPVYGAEASAFELQLYKRLSVPKSGWTSGRSSGWDADHIIPVAEGGGECDLSNYRTLCHPCHKQATAALAARLAIARKAATQTQPVNPDNKVTA